MVTASANLRAAKELISWPLAWTTTVGARRSDGHACGPLEPDAQCFCSLGALCRAYFNATGIDRTSVGRPPGHAELTQAAQTLLDDFGKKTLMPVATLNDTKPHKDVMAMFDLAIQIATAKEGMAA